MVRVFQIALRGKGKILFPQYSGMINFAGEIFLLGGGNLTRSDFDCSENFYLVGGINLWWEEQKFDWGSLPRGGAQRG